ncbi:hypothetical protein ACSSS7_007450 [Eimeria intestinalis]
MVRRLGRALGWLTLATALTRAAAEEEQPSAAAGAAAAADAGHEVLSSLAEARAQVEGSQEAHQYQAEVTRLMDIIINSLYTQRDVFLRELISNAADALEKARFLSISDQSVGEEKRELDIRVEADPQQKVLSICDSGVGMTKQELITNLGTVAKSGTSNFLEALANNNNDVNLIGQFGVGFYSAFLVADRVTVVSKNREDDQYIWESSADAKYYVVKDPRGNTLKRGTCVMLHLKEDATEFLEEMKLKDLIGRYSQFMAYPIFLRVTKKVRKEVPLEEGEADKEEEKTEGEKESEEEEDDEKKTEKKKTKTIEVEEQNWERVNEQKALWLRPKEEITSKEYADFYKSLTKDWSEPLVHMHFSAEGEVEFKALLFIPKRSPADVFSQYFGKQTSIKLYVRRVLVADAFDDLVPRYLHFVRGVVDSDDLPLNVSREQLQQHKILDIISKKVVRKTLDTIRKMYVDSRKKKEELEKELERETDEEKRKNLTKQIEEPSEYDNFYKEFSRNLMLGCYEDDINRSRIAKVLQFFTSKHQEKPISLETYVQHMPSDQNAIYYAAGESMQQLLSQPQMQYFQKKGYDVLMLLESMDEPCIQRLTEFEGKKFESTQKASMSVDETPDEKRRFKRVEKLYDPLLKWLKSRLGGKVTKVEVSRRLVTAPCAVVASQWGYSAQMEKVMKTQTFADPMHMKMMQGQKVFEINPHHKVMQYLLEKVKGGVDKMGEDEISIAEQLFDAAMLASGFDVEKPADLAELLYKGLAKEVGVDPSNTLQEELDLPEEEEEQQTEEKDDDQSPPSADDIFSSLNLDDVTSIKDEL